MRGLLRLTLACLLIGVPLVAIQGANAWRNPSNFENSAARFLSNLDAQASREPAIATADDGSLVATWSDQFAMQFARSCGGQFPEFVTWTTSTIPGSAVPAGTPNDTSKPSIAVRGTKVAVAYLFNFDRTGSPGQQHDVVLITGQLSGRETVSTLDTSSPTRVTTTDTDNAKRVAVAIDQSGNVELAWEDDPDSSPNDVVRYLEVGSGRAPVDLSDGSGTATWPVLAVDGGQPAPHRLHAERPGRRAVRGAAGLRPGSPVRKPDAQRRQRPRSGPDLAIVPNAGAAAARPIVVYDDTAACGKRQVFAIAPGLPATQLSDCTLTGPQDQATVAVRDSDSTVYAAWVRETKSDAPTGPLEKSRMQASVGWRWWSPIEVAADGRRRRLLPAEADDRRGRRAGRLGDADGERVERPGGRADARTASCRATSRA